jgi:hypothetical protein
MVFERRHPFFQIRRSDSPCLRRFRPPSAFPAGFGSNRFHGLATITRNVPALCDCYLSRLLRHTEYRHSFRQGCSLLGKNFEGVQTTIRVTAANKFDSSNHIGAVQQLLRFHFEHSLLQPGVFTRQGGSILEESVRNFRQFFEMARTEFPQLSEDSVLRAENSRNSAAADEFNPGASLVSLETE